MSATAVSAEASPAALWRRFAAMLYDLFPLLGLWIVGAGLWVLVFRRIYDPQHPDFVLHALLDLWLLVIAAAYFVISWTRVGATIGMRAWKLKLLRDDGTRVDRTLAGKRFVLALLSLAALGAGYWYALFDTERRTWHDRVCGTRMTRL
ncbi:MAG: RDD family protein [Proteobacteria bacterium]|nr:RDD family protein [Pseudomonadota bacterium]